MELELARSKGQAGRDRGFSHQAGEAVGGCLSRDWARFSHNGHHDAV